MTNDVQTDNEWNIPDEDFNHIKRLAYKYYVRSFATVELEDLIQEGCLAYIEKRKTYDASKNDYFMGFAYLRVRGAMLDYIEKLSIYGRDTVRGLDIENNPTKLAVYEEEHLEQYGVEDFDLEEEMMKREVLEKVEEYISKFPQLEKVIMQMYLIEGKSIVSIAKELNFNRQRIKRILEKALIDIREYFGVATEEPINFKELAI